MKSMLVLAAAVVCLLSVMVVAVPTTTQRQCSNHMQECDIKLQEQANRNGGPGPCCSRFELCSGEQFDNGPLVHRCFPILLDRR